MTASSGQTLISQGLALTTLLLIFNVAFQTSSFAPAFNKPVSGRKKPTAYGGGRNSDTSDVGKISAVPDVNGISGGSDVSKTSAASEINKKSAVPAVIRKSDPVTTINQTDPSGDLHQEFQTRREHLLKGCRRLNASSDLPAAAWLTFLTIKAPGPLNVCVPTKVGSTSWQKLRERLKTANVSGLRPATAMQVRHPFSRLTSAYRDKYLNGAPIGNYNSGWQNLTGSTTGWDFKWLHYWFPALITSGRIAPTATYLRVIEESLQVFKYISKRFKMEGKAMIFPDAKATEFDPHIYQVGSYMVANGRQVAIEGAAIEAYKDVMLDLVERHRNASFTFNEFLQFVVWSGERGVIDQHWTPYTDLCFPCQQDYQYILHLENASEESKVFLKDIGYPDEFRLTTEHRTKGLTENLNVSDIQYFKGVPPSLLEKVIKIYEKDFELFGYSKSLPL
ncbi:uncharacterized protein LOC125029013 [Penaeus chinensis]|uniref:uncharacterized protein LOC125029013 n=1 Tax=Penaeus chinensis TaxID=139456 RepID=UPI001FB5F11F|nr:uncharacterized protein LOC125029013 [Penaeus chinensis]XP_047474680.1 uncharacterized protein LOC125029013 [Penaeus chinensis]XP_047474681.1 uncharacterized protein LOC125029013 [Penaeus chinensis]XP_047474682.1 uncharacterized protein LOC125029013 [Penaeus chinensis]